MKIGNNITLDAIARRYIEEEARLFVDTVKDKSSEQLATNIIIDLKKQLATSKALNQPINNRKFISRMLKIKMFKFGKLQAKLLRTLAKRKVMESSMLKKELNTESFKTLIRDTRRKIKKYRGEGVVKLKHYRASEKIYWYLEIIPPSS